MQQTKSLQNRWKKLKKSNRLVTAELQKKIKKMSHVDHFPRPGEIDPMSFYIFSLFVHVPDAQLSFWEMSGSIDWRARKIRRNIMEGGISRDQIEIYLSYSRDEHKICFWLFMIRDKNEHKLMSQGQTTKFSLYSDEILWKVEATCYPHDFHESEKRMQW